MKTQGRKIRCKTRLLAAMVFIVLCVGCASNQFPVAEYDAKPERLLPHLAIFSYQPPESFRKECEDYAASSLLRYCELNSLHLQNLWVELQNAAVFEGVHFANNQVPYRLVISTARYSSDKAMDFGNAILSGASLMVIPMSTDLIIKVNAELYWYEHRLGTFRYNLPFEARQSLFSGVDSIPKDIARSIVSHIIRDAQNAGIFTTRQLVVTLKSTDYEQTLVVPERLPGFDKVDSEIFAHPLLGAYTRYVSQHGPEKLADWFVYPIRAVNWRDGEDVLKKEAANVRSDFDLIAKEEEYANVQYQAQKFSRWTLNGESKPVMQLTAHYTDSLQNDMTTRTYISTREDKFLKLRLTTLKGDYSDAQAQRLARQLIVQTRVSGESLFMAKARQQWRAAGPL